MTKPYGERIRDSQKNRGSNIVLALDLSSQPGLLESANKMILMLHRNICAIKMNFHLLLPLSLAEVTEINQTVHSCGIQSIADIKLNDIESTNEVAVRYLAKMGFDAIIVNPFIGVSTLRQLVNIAHQMDIGILALVYMSHTSATEGYGLNVAVNDSRLAMYKVFLERANQSSSDGIIVGATHIDILKEICNLKDKDMPVYSPGVGIQGGDIEQAIRTGTDYLIVGRTIIEASQPLEAAKEIQGRVVSALASM